MTEPENKISLDQMRGILGMQHEPEKEVAEAKVDDDGKIKVYNSTLEKLGDAVKEVAVAKLKPAITDTIVKVTAEEVGVLKANLDEKYATTHSELLALAESVRVVEIKTAKGVKKLTGVQHNQFQNLLTVVNAAQPALMVGPAGTGKTYAAELVSQALGLSFHSISVGSQTSKSDLQGYMDANGNYRGTQFREAYEKGGIFLLDEADAGNSNVLILLNAALSNGYMAFPDGMVKAHDDFRMIATANTFGHGANRQYVGRNQLDAATLDRFVVVVWDIDDRVEENMAGTAKDAKRWLAVVRAVRKRVVEELELRVVVSPRATLRGAILLNAGMPFEDVLQIALVGNMPASEKGSLESLARTAWGKTATVEKATDAPAAMVPKKK
jgi:midasin (ATPase involved in ribosome maturation)